MRNSGWKGEWWVSFLKISSLQELDFQFFFRFNDLFSVNQRLCCKVFIFGYYVGFNSQIIYVCCIICVIEVIIKGRKSSISDLYGVLVMEIMAKYYWLYVLSEFWYLVCKKGFAKNVRFTLRSIANQVNEGQKPLYHGMVKGFTGGRNPPKSKVDK